MTLAVARTGSADNQPNSMQCLAFIMGMLPQMFQDIIRMRPSSAGGWYHTLRTLWLLPWGGRRNLHIRLPQSHPITSHRGTPTDQANHIDAYLTNQITTQTCPIKSQRRSDQSNNNADLTNQITMQPGAYHSTPTDGQSANTVSDWLLLQTPFVTHPHLQINWLSQLNK